MILTNIGYSNTNFDDTSANSTYREEIHKLNEDHRWARFGNDLLIGHLADIPISRREWEFLPDNLSQDFATEGRKDNINDENVLGDGNYPNARNEYITLVDSTFYLIAPQSSQATTKKELITPFKVGVAIALLILGVSIIEWRRKKNYWMFDTCLFILTGLPGLILFAMIFSQHPTVQVNFQIFLLNPANLIFVWKTTKKMRQGKSYWYYDIWGLCLLVSLLLEVWQDYAEGMGCLALSLLIRYAIKSSLLDLSENKLNIQKRITKQFRRKKLKYKPLEESK